MASEVDSGHEECIDDILDDLTTRLHFQKRKGQQAMKDLASSNLAVFSLRIAICDVRAMQSASVSMLEDIKEAKKSIAKNQEAYLRRWSRRSRTIFFRGFRIAGANTSNGSMSDGDYHHPYVPVALAVVLGFDRIVVISDTGAPPELRHESDMVVHVSDQSHLKSLLNLFDDTLTQKQKEELYDVPRVPSVQDDMPTPVVEQGTKQISDSFAKTKHKKDDKTGPAKVNEAALAVAVAQAEDAAVIAKLSDTGTKLGQIATEASDLMLEMTLRDLDDGPSDTDLPQRRQHLKSPHQPASTFHQVSRANGLDTALETDGQYVTTSSTVHQSQPQAHNHGPPTYLPPSHGSSFPAAPTSGFPPSKSSREVSTSTFQTNGNGVASLQAQGYGSDVLSRTSFQSQSREQFPSHSASFQDHVGNGGQDPPVESGWDSSRGSHNLFPYQGRRNEFGAGTLLQGQGHAGASQVSGANFQNDFNVLATAMAQSSGQGRSGNANLLLQSLYVGQGQAETVGANFHAYPSAAAMPQDEELIIRYWPVSEVRTVLGIATRIDIMHLKKDSIALIIDKLMEGGFQDNCCFHLLHNGSPPTLKNVPNAFSKVDHMNILLRYLGEPVLTPDEERQLPKRAKF